MGATHVLPATCSGPASRAAHPRVQSPMQTETPELSCPTCQVGKGTRNRFRCSPVYLPTQGSQARAPPVTFHKVFTAT